MTDTEERSEVVEVEVLTLEATAPPTLHERLYRRIRGLSEFRMDSLATMRPETMRDRDWKLVVHAVMDRLLTEGIAFSPLDGVYRRIAKSKQAEGRAKRHGRAALKKIERTIKLVKVAIANVEDPAEKRRLENQLLRREEADMFARAKLRGAGIPRPKGI
jgi:hypothetical protein